ncbi:hypothetical protein OH76DRAFT_1423248 [Lentinus brumalis]|uniref:Protein kinase domain-containing protein n=1 Tax=Lentinus brumalis TaxID=2498619 RepID=A0A371CLW3_9APHY|nr:hypothetical protein OH76DRAFT_1423248 [Polyporus brumalis]
MVVYRTDVCPISQDRKPDPDGKWTAAICKHARDEDNFLLLQHEAEVYEKLKHLQGDGVPRFIGFYAGNVADVPWAVLVVEDCGGLPLDRCWVNLANAPLYFRKAVAGTMLRIHQAGVVHGAFEDSNIIVTKRNGSYLPTILNFDGVYPWHDVCRWTYTIDGVYKDLPPQPEHKEGVCSELREVWNKAELWNPCMVDFNSPQRCR